MCDTAKPIDSFSVRKASKDGLSYKCRTCQKAYADDWRAKNPDAFREWSAPRKKELRDRFQVWAQKNKEQRARFMADWTEKNRARVNAKNARRVANRLRATPAWADLDAILLIYGRAIELTKLTGVPHEVDHFYPLQGRKVCGLHCEANLQILTQAQNISKLNRMPEEWAGLRCREEMAA